jgi:hypothetical protein
VNRILALIVGVAVIALVGFGVFVFMASGPRPSLSAMSGEQQAAAPAAPAGQAEAPAAEDAAEAVPEPPEEMAAQTPAAKERFDAWAKPLRDDGLTVTAERVAEAGDTVSVAGLVLEETSEVPGWRWTAERASLYDKGLFHLQAAGKTQFIVMSGEGQETTWSGRADAIGIALKRDPRDALARSITVRVNGLSLAPEGATAPFTLGDGQIRILLKGGTGLLTPGTDVALRFTDLTLPPAAGSAFGDKLAAFTAEFPIDKSITRYSLQQVMDFFKRGQAGVKLGAIAADWGVLHFTGKGTFGLSAAGAPQGRFEVSVKDALPLLDAIAAAGNASAEALADAYAGLLLQTGQHPDEDGAPMVIAIKDKAVVLEGAGGDIALAP